MATERAADHRHATNGTSRWQGPVRLDELPLTARALIRLGWELADERAKRVRAEAALTALQAYVRALPYRDGETTR